MQVSSEMFEPFSFGQNGFVVSALDAMSLEPMIRDEIFTTGTPDCYLMIKKTTIRLGCSKDLLRKHSKVFEVTFKGEGKEIEIDGEKNSIIEAMKYIHRPSWCPDHVVSDTKYYESMIPFAHQYEIPGLLLFCENGIPTDCLDEKMLIFADKYKLEGLIDRCIEEITKKYLHNPYDEKKMLLQCRSEILLRLDQSLCDYMLLQISAICNDPKGYTLSQINSLIQDYRKKTFLPELKSRKRALEGKKEEPPQKYRTE